MLKRILYFVEFFKACCGWLLYLKRVGFRWPKRALLNLLVVIMGLFLVISNGHKFNNGVDTTPGMSMAAMGSYPGAAGYYSFVAAIAIPGDGAMFVAPANVAIYATVVNNVSSVVRLDFYADGRLLYSNQYASYVFTWKGVPAGQYVLTVRATNYNGETTASLPVKITVFNPAPSGCTCPAKCGESTDIAPPFSIDGAGEYCWETVSLIQYVNSVNLDVLLINGIDFKNCLSNQLPSQQSGRYFIYYKSSVESGHFEMK